ncbi:presenilins-associated rhomboid-like protein, mitochondrial isoform X1 [Patella vulgata]|uniref:presenilins-associated rhomboid-like protein, mitochondrial isoform X1 n=2 Tax=Patella vulgata TaxID=6465 RepID=UPI0024A9CE3C|nr:presenilins-associated rhomboid-like protein, mitochondrial isoform X1 [Patella vulgata]
MAASVSRSCLLCYRFNKFENIIVSRLRINQSVKTGCQFSTSRQIAKQIPKSNRLNLKDNLSMQYRSFISRKNREETIKISRLKQNNLESNEPSRFSQLIRPFGFTVLACGSSFVGAMIWNYENIRYHAKKMMNHAEERKIHFQKTFKNYGFREHVNSIWNQISPGQKLTYGIVCCNLAVFLLWRAPNLHSFLLRYFACSTGKPAMSMILSSFSQHSFMHFAVNMYVLCSFAGVAIQLLGKEQFLAVYLSGATVSSMTSILNKFMRKRFFPSVGASGALMAILGAICYSYPDSRLSIAFVGDIIPHSFSADSGMKGIILLDLVGLVMGWKMFDHAAHLGGIFFGIWYMRYGRELIWGKRQEVMKFWHDLRGNP